MGTHARTHQGGTDTHGTWNTLAQAQTHKHTHSWNKHLLTVLEPLNQQLDQCQMRTQPHTTTQHTHTHVHALISGSDVIYTRNFK